MRLLRAAPRRGDEAPPDADVAVDDGDANDVRPFTLSLSHHAQYLSLTLRSLRSLSHRACN